MVTAVPASLLRPFLEMEARLEKEPETVQAEIALGTYLMSPRPRARHGTAQGRLFAALHERFGVSKGSEPPDWLFVIEPEIRSEKAYSRLAPDVAGWRRSTSGWPDFDQTPIPLVPEWVAEVLSPGTAATDRGIKADAYGAMGVGWLWLVDPDAGRVEPFVNVRGRMVPGPVFTRGQKVQAEPFSEASIPIDAILL
jgi:Uma2 family endonuclease